MSNHCIDPKQGKLMHAFELQILSNSETILFEEHLLICSFCFNEAQQLSPAVNLLTKALDLRALEVNESNIIKKELISPLTTLRSYFHSLKKFIFRPAISFLIICLMSYPTYIGLNSLLLKESIKTVQALHLNTHRSPSEHIYEYDTNLDLVLNFICSSDGFAQPPTVILKFQDTLNLITIPKFGGFDQYNMGRLFLPKSLLRDGKFSLHVTDQNGIVLYQFSFTLRHQ